ncbi:MAG: biotin--[acetyl-CoA-carboxylase] ligase [Bacteroidales bacterium]|nr:biotin--[acetyl-CoA-carboxylase] ligase [Bacteroidales bacterium]
MDIRYFDELESTNNYCKLLDISHIEEFTVIVAGHQTAGIGQQGNRWESERGCNLTFSLILKPTFLPASKQYDLTMAVAVGMRNAVESLTGCKGVSIKWPNDIYVENKKICGILTTCSLSGGRIAHSVVGIGLNVNQTHFPSWVPNPISMNLLTQKNYELKQVLAFVLESISSSYNLLKDNSTEIRKQYLKNLFRRDCESDFVFNGETIRATIQDVNQFGHLQLVASDGRSLCCDMKEIKYLI